MSYKIRMHLCEPIELAVNLGVHRFVERPQVGDWILIDDVRPSHKNRPMSLEVLRYQHSPRSNFFQEHYGRRVTKGETSISLMVKVNEKLHKI
jgi:hypothetical protein